VCVEFSLRSFRVGSARAARQPAPRPTAPTDRTSGIARACRTLEAPSRQGGGKREHACRRPAPSDVHGGITTATSRSILPMSKQRKEYNRMPWKTLAAKVGTTAMACAADVSYATFISGHNYLPGAICMQRSLRKAGNQCPVDIVYDDRSPTLNLSAAEWNLLSQVYGRERLIPLSSLMALHPTSAEEMRYSLFQRTVGRRLYHRGVEHLATHSKLWLWALPRRRVIFVDADMVVLGALDWLASLQLEHLQVAAMDLGNRNSSMSRFNSGLMVMRPAAEHVHRLTHLALVARHPEFSDHVVVPKANEKNFGDQSILNHYFQGNWLALPHSLVHPVHPKNRIDPAMALKRGAAVLHWVGEPKPWSGLASKVGAAPKAKPTLHAELWWQLCKEHVSDVPHRWMG
jgi:hypothetical protein